jgi:hypothetical protein
MMGRDWYAKKKKTDASKIHCSKDCVQVAIRTSGSVIGLYGGPVLTWRKKSVYVQQESIRIIGGMLTKGEANPYAT